MRARCSCGVCRVCSCGAHHRAASPPATAPLRPTRRLSVAHVPSSFTLTAPQPRCCWHFRWPRWQPSVPPHRTWQPGPRISSRPGQSKSPSTTHGHPPGGPLGSGRRPTAASSAVGCGGECEEVADSCGCRRRCPPRRPRPPRTCRASQRAESDGCIATCCWGEAVGGSAASSVRRPSPESALSTGEPGSSTMAADTTSRHPHPSR